MNITYCRLYTKSEKNYTDLFMFLKSSLFCESCDFDIMQNNFFKMELIKNKDSKYNGSDILLWPDFLFWPYFIEIERLCDSFDDFVKQLKAFMHFLRENDIQVVASCDFEDLLGQKPIF